MGNNSYFRFDDDNKTKYRLSIITREMGKLKTHRLDFELAIDTPYLASRANYMWCLLWVFVRKLALWWHRTACEPVVFACRTLLDYFLLFSFPHRSLPLPQYTAWDLSGGMWAICKLLTLKEQPNFIIYWWTFWMMYWSVIDHMNLFKPRGNCNKQEVSTVLAVAPFTNMV